MGSAKENKYHLWFSADQKEFGRRMDRLHGDKPNNVFAKTELGEIVEITEMTRTLKLNSKWADYQYLGKGEHHHNEYEHV